VNDSFTSSGDRAPAKSKNGLAPAGHFAGSPRPDVVNDPFIASDDMNESLGFNVKG